MTCHADKADTTIISALQRLKPRPDSCLTRVRHFLWSHQPLLALFVFIQSICFPLDCKAKWWLTAPRYPSLRGSWGHSHQQPPLCDTFGGWASRVPICRGGKRHQCLYSLSKVWQTGCRHCLGLNLHCPDSFWQCFLVCCFIFNENGNLSVREEWSGYGFLLSDMFFQVEFSFFFNLKSCIQIRGYNHI